MVELLVAVALLSVVVAVGAWAAQARIGQYRLMSAARLFQSDVESLRALAVAENRESRLVFAESDAALDPSAPQVGTWLLQVGNQSTGSTAWDTLPVDDGAPDGSEGERSLDPGGSEARSGISLAPPPPLTGPGLGNADAIVFSPRGFVSNPVSDFVDGFISLGFVNKRGTPVDGALPRVTLRVARTGLAHIETSPAAAPLADAATDHP